MEKRVKEMTIEQLVLSIFQATTRPVTKEEYKTLGISKFNMLKRRKFSNVYRTLILYLMKLSIAGAFPKHSSDLLETFDKFLKMAYEGDRDVRKKIEERLRKFEELTEMQEEEPFLKLALHVSEMFEHRPRKVVYAAALNNRIKTLFLNFLMLGEEIKIIE